MPMAIVTPIWRPHLSADERAFLAWTQWSNSDIDLWFAVPEGLEVKTISHQFPRWSVRRFPSWAFESVRSYSLWLTQPEFYEAFDRYEFMTICQTDAVLVRPLSGQSFSDVDYVGAPWIPPVRALVLGRRVYVHSRFEDTMAFTPARWLGRRMAVGNGGLSARRVDTMVKVTRWASRRFSPAMRSQTLEDAFLCAVGPKRGLRIMSAVRAQEIFCETGAQGLDMLPDVVGFHGLRRWNPLLADRIVASAPQPLP